MKNKDEIQLAVICEKVNNIQENVSDIKKKLDNEYITKVEFDPIKKIVYGIITAIGLAFIGALVKIVFIP
jgi:hypothetical protein